MNGSPAGPFRLRPTPRELLILVMIFGLGVWLRFAAASGRELWLDETHSALLAGLPLPQLVAFIRGDVHPPVYFLALAGWTRLVGDAPTALRGFSILVSLLTGAVAYVAVARLVRSRAAGVMAAGLILIAPVLLAYAVEVRMYALAALIVTAMLALLPAPGEDWSCPRALGFSAGALLACLTHYMALFIVAAVLAWLILESRRHHRGLRPVTTAGLVIATGFLPWTPVLLQQRELKQELRTQELAGTKKPAALSYGSTANATPPLGARLRSVVENAASTAGIPGLSPRWVAAALGLPIVLAAGAVLFGGLRGAPVSRLFLLVALAVALGCLALGATARRFMILAVPFWIAAIAEAWFAIRQSGRRGLAAGMAGGVAAVFLLGGVLIVRESPAAPVSAIVQHLARHYREGDLVVFNAAYTEIPFTYHARRIGLNVRTHGFPVGIREWWSRQPFKGWGGPVITAAELSSFVEDIGREEAGRTVWLVLFDTRYYDPQDSLLTVLSRHALSVQPVIDSAGYRLRTLRFPGAARVGGATPRLGFDREPRRSSKENP
ncbi:MAG: glycosyltransferase family 39 protein, partial [Gemmatimonadales bacterium]